MVKTFQPYWVSWWEPWELYFAFEWHGPWWVSGERDVSTSLNQILPVDLSICAAVMAESEDQARSKITNAHDNPVELEWRFVTAKPADWSPFNDRFTRRDWMNWPWPVEE